MPTLTKLFTRQEVSQHSTKDDCWIILDGKVYDVSTYMDDHPGGDDVILETVGKDGSDDFEDAGHSKDARDQLESYCIGEIDPDSAIPQTETILIGKSQKLMDLTKQYWVVPAAVVGISIVVGLLYLRKK